MKGYIDDFIEEVNFSELRRGSNKENNYTLIYEQYFQTDDEFCIVEELCDGDLLQLKKTKRKFTSKEIYQIFKHIKYKLTLNFIYICINLLASLIG